MKAMIKYAKCAAKVVVVLLALLAVLGILLQVTGWKDKTAVSQVDWRDKAQEFRDVHRMAAAFYANHLTDNKNDAISIRRKALDKVYDTLGEPDSRAGTYTTGWPMVAFGVSADYIDSLYPGKDAVLYRSKVYSCMLFSAHMAYRAVVKGGEYTGLFDIGALNSCLFPRNEKTT